MSACRKQLLLDYRDPETLLPLPSYDLWEERYAVHAYTAASELAGLRAAAKYNNAAAEMTIGIKEHLWATLPYLEWCEKNALPSGVLAEQVHPMDGSEIRREGPGFPELM